MIKYIKKYFNNKAQEIKNYGKKNLIVRLSTIVVTIIIASLILVLFTNTNFLKNENTIVYNETYGTYSKLVKAKVIEMNGEYYPDKSEGRSYEVAIYFKCELLEGANKGKVVDAVQYMNDYTSNFYNKIKNKQKIYVVEETTSAGDEPTYYFSGNSLSYDHLGGIIALTIVLVILLLIISKTKGLLTILSLALTILVIVFIFLPSILLGKNIYLLTLFACVFIITTTYIIVVGLNKKCLCASLGCFSGLALSGILTIITMKALNVTGFYAEEDVSEVTMLFQTFYNFNIIIDLKGLIFASTIIGALGAVMDVSLSLSSALKEVYDNSSETSFIKTIKSGFVIGKDMIGTMVNTLILAYIASDLAFILYFISHHSMGFVFQSEYLAIAIAQSLVGSIAMVLTIPLTSAICALVYNKKNKLIHKEEETINE